MLILSVIGLVLVGCVVVFIVVAIRAPTIEDMPDHRIDLTDEMVAELRRLSSQARGLSAFAEENFTAESRRKAS